MKIYRVSWYTRENDQGELKSERHEKYFINQNSAEHEVEMIRIAAERLGTKVNPLIGELEVENDGTRVE
jgi:hypothetical protein